MEQWLDLLQTAAVIAASATAIYGINSWHREMTGKKEYELAAEMLSLFYKARDLISAMRNPFGFMEEGMNRPVLPNESLKQKQARDQAYIVWERYLKNEDTFNKLKSLRYQCMAIYGKEAEKPFDMMEKILQELRTATMMLGREWYRRTHQPKPLTSEEARQLDATVDKYFDVFWEGAKTPDSITEMVKEMISDIEGLCEERLTKKTRCQQGGIMNLTQKRVIGWASLIVGVAMVVGAVISAWEWAFNQLGHLLASPLLYLGLIIGVAGAVVLMGDEKLIMALRAKRKIYGWVLVLLGAVITVGRFIQSLNPIERSGTYYIYSWTRINDFFRQFFLNPVLYFGIAFIVVGIMVIKKQRKTGGEK